MSELKPVLDHVVINVLANLDNAFARYRQLGFQLTERGHHTLGSSNHLAIFGQNYLELLGYEPERASQRAELWTYPEGLTGLVFKPPADANFANLLKARNVPASEPREFSRPVELPSGSQDAKFRVVHLDEVIPDARVFFCHHFTPELVWRDEWRHHPNGVTDITGFAISSHEPRRSAEVFGRVYGSENLLPTDGGLRLPSGNADVLFLMPEEIARRFGSTAPVASASGGARMAALTFRTASLPTLRRLLSSAGVQFTDEDGRILVPADEACGVVLVFSA